MSSNVKPIPSGYHTVTPYLVVSDIGEAIDFYRRALGARETTSQKGPDGSLIHGEVQIGDSRVMLGQEGVCEQGARKGCDCSLMLYVEDADAAVRKAVAAGAQQTMAVENTFWGDRMGQVTDPFGHSWAICTHVEDLTHDEVARRAQDFFAAHAHK